MQKFVRDEAFHPATIGFQLRRSTIRDSSPDARKPLSPACEVVSTKLHSHPISPLVGGGLKNTAPKYYTTGLAKTCTQHNLFRDFEARCDEPVLRPLFPNGSLSLLSRIPEMAQCSTLALLRVLYSASPPIFTALA